MLRSAFFLVVLAFSAASAFTIQTGGDSGQIWKTLKTQFSPASPDSQADAGKLDKSGKSFERRLMIDSALNCYRAALAIHLKQDRPANTAAEYSNIAAIYTIKGTWKLALSNISNAVSYGSKSADTALWDSLIVRKAEALVHAGNPDSAIYYYRIALALCSNIAKCSQGRILFDMGTTYQGNLFLDSALTCWLQAASAFGNEHDLEGKGKAFHNCAIYFAKKQNYHDALNCFDSALVAFTLCKFPRGIDEAKSGIGTVWYNLAVQKFNGGDVPGASVALDSAAAQTTTREFADKVAKFRQDIRGGGEKKQQ